MKLHNKLPQFEIYDIPALKAEIERLVLLDKEVKRQFISEYNKYTAANNTNTSKFIREFIAELNREGMEGYNFGQMRKYLNDYLRRYINPISKMDDQVGIRLVKPK